MLEQGRALRVKNHGLAADARFVDGGIKDLSLIHILARVHDHPVAFHRKPEALLLGDALHELKVALLPLLHPLVDLSLMHI